jgi:mono/diheme cytochrome c family protein
MNIEWRLRGALTGAALAAALTTAGPAGAETLLERGSYLVNSLMACDGCHTPRTPDGGFVMDKRFSGGSQTFEEPAFLVKGANITPDKDTGIGAWSDDELKRALQHGVRPSGVPLATAMPFTFYKIMTPRDLDALVAYIRTVTPLRNEVQMPSYRKDINPILIPGAEKPFAGDLNVPAQRGFYLATLGHCMECHAGYVDGVPDYKGSLGKGGRVFAGPFGSVVAANITSSKTKGLGAWSDAEIKQVLVSGKGRDGHQLKLPMARSVYFKNLLPEDLDAIVAYLRTLPAID